MTFLNIRVGEQWSPGTYRVHQTNGGLDLTQTLSSTDNILGTITNITDMGWTTTSVLSTQRKSGTYSGPPGTRKPPGALRQTSGPSRCAGLPKIQEKRQWTNRCQPLFSVFIAAITIEKNHQR